MEGMGGFNPPHNLHRTIPPQLNLTIPRPENNMLFTHIPQYPPILRSTFPKMHPLYSSPAMFQDNSKLDITATTKEVPRAKPDKIDSLISAVSDISTTEWKAQQELNKLHANNARNHTELDYPLDLLDKIEKSTSDEMNSLKSSDSIESVTSAINLATQVSLIPLKDEVVQLEVSISSRTVQIIAMLIRVLATRFQHWRAEPPTASLNGILKAEAKGNVLDLYNGASVPHGVNNYSSNSDSSGYSSLPTHLQLLRYYCHLRNTELMANGNDVLVGIYGDVCKALVPSVYGDTLQSIPPTFGALSIVLDALIAESSQKSDSGGDFTYSSCQKLDWLMLKLDSLVTERTCQTPFVAESKNTLFKPDYEDGMFSYLPSCPYYSRCCKYLDPDRPIYDLSVKHTSCRYAVCNKCFIICLCQCPPLSDSSKGMASTLSLVGSVAKYDFNEFSDFNYTKLPHSHDVQYTYYSVNNDVFPCTIKDNVPAKKYSISFQNSLGPNTKINASLIQTITSPLLRIAKLVSEGLKCPFPIHEVEVFWWRSLEAYYGLMLGEPKSKDGEDSPLGKYLATLIDLDEFVLSISQDIGKIVGNFKCDVNHIDVLIPGSNVVYRRFEKYKLGKWYCITSAVEFLFILNSLIADLSFDRNTLSFITKAKSQSGEYKVYPIYFQGISSCLKAHFSLKNPDFALTLEEVGSDRFDIPDYEFVYKSIALEVEESLMGLIHQESMQEIDDVGKVPNPFKRTLFNIVINQSSYVLKLPVQFCGTCYPLRRQCIDTRLCFTCSGSKDIAEGVMKSICGGTKYSVDKGNREISVTFPLKALGEEPIRLFHSIEEEYISECIFQACKSVTNAKVAVISPAYKKVSTFTVQACGSMENAIAEAKEYCKRIHLKGVKEEINIDPNHCKIKEGTLGASNWLKLSEYLDEIFKKFNGGVVKKKSKQAKQCQIGMSEDDYSLILGDKCFRLPIEKICNLETLGSSIVYILKNFKTKPCSTAFLNYFDEASPRML